MARKRQGRKCTAHRTDGEPCGGWAMTAQQVCRAHGGMAPQARYAAYVRQADADFRRQYDREYGRFLREWRAWQVRRVLVTARLLQMPIAEVSPFHIGVCQGIYGEPEGEETAPKMRRDRRFGPRKPWRGGRRPPGVIGD